MSPIIIPPELLGMSPGELLEYLKDCLKTGKIAKELVVVIRSQIKLLLAKKRYGFTPDPQMASDLQAISKSEAYKRIADCIGETRYLSVIKLALRIQHLSYTKGSAEISKINHDVSKKHGKNGINILHMGNTGILLPVIKHLSDLKIDGDHNQETMREHFITIIHMWGRSTIFHKTEDGEKVLVRKITGLMGARYEIFFVFGIGTAGTQAATAIASLRKKGTIQSKGYMDQLAVRDEDEKNRVHYGWVFKELNPFAMGKVTLSR